MDIVYKTRVFLIRIGKTLPFIVCGIVLLSYVECMFALIMKDYVEYEGYTVLNKPISWMIGQYFEYNLITVVMLFVISVAIRTCKWNKISTGLLLVQLGEKEYFSTIELYQEQVMTIVIINIVVFAFLCYKGIKQLDLLNFVKFLPKYFVG